jgi:hypothetical protein
MIVMQNPDTSFQVNDLLRLSLDEVFSKTSRLSIHHSTTSHHTDTSGKNKLSGYSKFFYKTVQPTASAIPTHPRALRVASRSSTLESGTEMSSSTPITMGASSASSTTAKLHSHMTVTLFKSTLVPTVLSTKRKLNQKMIDRLWLGRETVTLPPPPTSPRANPSRPTTQYKESSATYISEPTTPVTDDEEVLYTEQPLITNSAHNTSMPTSIVSLTNDQRHLVSIPSVGIPQRKSASKKPTWAYSTKVSQV